MLPLWYCARRFTHSKITAASVVDVVRKRDAINVELNGLSLCLPMVWLRDHCRSPASFNHSTNQRRSNATDLTKQDRVTVSDFSFSPDSLVVSWSDGHTTELSGSQLAEWTTVYEEEKSATTSQLHSLWNDGHIQIPRMHIDSFSFPEFARVFFDVGVVCVDGVDATAAATESFCHSVSPIHDTFFGAFWTFSNKAELHQQYEDTAYGSDEIGPHTDGCYFENAPGVQVFHCLRPAEVGGDTLLVDGFAAAEHMREQWPEDFHLLCTLPICHEYREGLPNLLHSTAAPTTIRVDGDGRVKQVRFNPYDRAPFRVLGGQKEAADAIRWYEAYERFSRLLHSPSAAARLSLQPGTVVFIDNYRVMHARTAFQGTREMTGCYLSRDSLLAKARPHLQGVKRTVL